MPGYYGCQTLAHINSWRKRFSSPMLPWIFVHLQPYGGAENNASPLEQECGDLVGNPLAELRHEQLNALQLPNTAYASVRARPSVQSPPPIFFFLFRALFISLSLFKNWVAPNYWLFLSIPSESELTPPLQCGAMCMTHDGFDFFYCYFKIGNGSWRSRFAVRQCSLSKQTGDCKTDCCCCHQSGE